MRGPWAILTGRTEDGLAKCWLAGTLSTKVFHRKFKSSTINDINVGAMCDDIKEIVEKRNDATSGRFSLNLLSTLLYGITEILSYQTSSLDKDLKAFEQILINDKTTNGYEEIIDEEIIDPLDMPLLTSAQLDKDLNLLPDESCIDIIYRNKMDMDDAAYLEFGDLTDEGIPFLNSCDGNISLEMFERMRIISPNITQTLNMSFEIEQNWMDLEVRSLEKRTLPEINIQDIEQSMSNLLTPKKRMPDEEKHIDTPSKRRRLRFEEGTDKDEVITAPMAKSEAASAFIMDYPLETLPDIELAQESSVHIERKSKKKSIDKIKELSSQMIRKWLDNVSVHTVPLNIVNINAVTLNALFKSPSTNFISIYKKKSSKLLNKLYHMHLKVHSSVIHMEDRRLLEESSVLRYDETRSDKMQGLDELSTILGTNIDSSVHTKSLKELEHYSISENERHKEISISDSRKMEVDLEKLEQNLELLDIDQSACPDLIPHEKENFQETLELSQSCPLTKQDLLALLEVHWHDTEIIQFTDIISPSTYNIYDAVCCFLLFLELHKEKKITFGQRTPYSTLYIEKY